MLVLKEDLGQIGFLRGCSEDRQQGSVDFSGPEDHLKFLLISRVTGGVAPPFALFQGCCSDFRKIEPSQFLMLELPKGMGSSRDQVHLLLLPCLEYLTVSSHGT